MIPSKGCGFTIKISVMSWLLLGLFSTAGMAHRVTLSVIVNGTSIHTQSRYPDGRAVKQGKITVFDAAGKPVLAGETDKFGKFDFSLTEQTDIRIVLNDGRGHKDDWVLSSNHGASATRLKTEPDDHHAHEHPRDLLPDHDQREDKNHNDDSDPIILSPGELKVIIDTSIDKKLKPIVNSISELQEKGPVMGDILSGLGYILGLVGVGMYVHYRRKLR